jgi:hypothetical protein
MGSWLGSDSLHPHTHTHTHQERERERESVCVCVTSHTRQHLVGHLPLSHSLSSPSSLIPVTTNPAYFRSHTAQSAPFPSLLAKPRHALPTSTHQSAHTYTTLHSLKNEPSHTTQRHADSRHNGTSAWVECHSKNTYTEVPEATIVVIRIHAAPCTKAQRHRRGEMEETYVGVGRTIKN